MLFDTHCHLYDEQFQPDLEEVITRAKQAGVQWMVVPGVDVPTSRAAIQLAERFDGVFAAVGIHPESLENLDEGVFAEIEELAGHEKVVAIGEIGLDYYWDVAPRSFQQDVLRRQLQMAKRVNLPVIIHNRDATADTVRLLEEECKNSTGGVMHCFTGSREVAEQCMKLGFYISYGGPVTFKNAKQVPEIAATIPSDRLLVETDAPYLSPHPYRGKRNEPERVTLVAEKLAQVRGTDIDTIGTETTRNALRLFSKIPATGV